MTRKRKKGKTTLLISALKYVRKFWHLRWSERLLAGNKFKAQWGDSGNWIQIALTLQMQSKKKYCFQYMKGGNVAS